MKRTRTKANIQHDIVLGTNPQSCSESRLLVFVVGEVQRQQAEQVKMNATDSNHSIQVQVEVIQGSFLQILARVNKDESLALK